MFWKIILWAFLIYIIYRFVFEFLIPVYKATQKIKKGFRDMQEKANENMNRQEQNTSATNADANQNKKETLGEYILTSRT
ncbi:MAG: hypothetical protein WDO19_17340 [Bacteroidota bacterium]